MHTKRSLKMYRNKAIQRKNKGMFRKISLTAAPIWLAYAIIIGCQTLPRKTDPSSSPINFLSLTITLFILECFLDHTFKGKENSRSYRENHMLYVFSFI